MHLIVYLFFYWNQKYWTQYNWDLGSESAVHVFIIINIYSLCILCYVWLTIRNNNYMAVSKKVIFVFLKNCFHLIFHFTYFFKFVFLFIGPSETIICFLNVLKYIFFITSADFCSDFIITLTVKTEKTFKILFY